MKHATRTACTAGAAGVASAASGTNAACGRGQAGWRPGAVPTPGRGTGSFWKEPRARNARPGRIASWILIGFMVVLPGLFAPGARAGSVVVFNEIMYHPATNEAPLEWVELHNQMSVDVDLSGWRLAGGIAYAFPGNSIIKGRGFLVVARAPEALQSAASTTQVFGPFSGRLSNGGEKLELRDLSQRLMDAISYDTDGAWPAGADGSGGSLAKKHPNLASQPAENWTVSAEIGGTPGAANFPMAPPLPSLVFNEVSCASEAGFWIEIINPGSATVDLAGVAVARTGESAPACTLPTQALAPGGLVQLPQAQLGFGAASGQKLFLFAPGRKRLLDAVAVQTSGRGRHPDGAGSWMYPAAPTPGASNTFNLHNEIVFNEVMYHHRPIDPRPAVTNNLTVLGSTGAWRFNDSGADPGSAWRERGYEDAAWPLGAGPMYFRTAAPPAPAGTVLAAGRTTYYFRTGFHFTGAAGNQALNLSGTIADGAVIYLNGTEISRMNLPPGPVHYATPASGPPGGGGAFGPLTLPTNLLVQGLNVLAVEAHQFTAALTASGIVLSGGGLALVEEGPLGGTPPPNLARQPGAAPFVIDSLAGYPIHNFTGLTDGRYGNGNSWIGNSGNPGYAGVSFGGLFTISSIAFGRDNTATYSDRTLGTYRLLYTQAAAPGTGTPFTGNASTGWAVIGTLNYQNAGTGLFANPSWRHRFTFTPVAATGIRLEVPGTGMAAGADIDELEVNPPANSGPVAWGAELVLTTTLAPAQPFTPSGEEWVELHNRSSNQVDLADWRLDGGIGYRFPAGTVMQAGGYLVVAREAAALQALWPEVASQILGNFANRLRPNQEVSLKDAAGNPVNAIRILGAGWSDGGGSSLELIDPRADNSNPAAWADSAEGARSAWCQVTYRMAAGQRFGSSAWNEFRLGMLTEGEALVDDVSLVRDPDGAREQLIQNGDFEATPGNTHWRMLGNHGRSQIIPDPDQAANHVLKVVATSAAETSHNHIESSLVNNTALVDGQEYEVRFRARWLAGSPQLYTSAYQQKLARTTRLPIPDRQGTPGAPNSRRVANMGPTLADLNHTPIIPRAGEPVTISVRAQDPDGVAAVQLNYRLNPAPAFTSLPMTPQAGGVWKATVPGQPAGRIIHFYITARDNPGAITWAPAQGPDSRALCQVADAQGSSLPAHELRIIQLDADRDFLFQATNLLSQERLGATVIYDRAEVFYDAGVRLQGTAAGRARDGDDYVSYDVAFPPGHRFRGAQNNVGLDRSGRTPAARQQDEVYILHMFQRAGLPCHRVDLCHLIAPKTSHTGTAILQLGTYGGSFASEQFGQEGSIFNLDLTYEPSVTVNGHFEAPKLPVPLQPHLATDFTDLGNDPEQYRWAFDIRYGERADDYTGIMRLCQAMGLPQAQFDTRIGAALEVETALRHTALTILCGIGDIYFSPTPSLPHNCRIFLPADGGPGHFLPWDMDFVFSLAPNNSIFPTTSCNLAKLVIHPANRRLYLWQVQDLCQTVFNTASMNPWLAHYGSVVGQNYGGASAYIQSRRSSALAQLPPAAPFAITSNGGKDFATVTNQIVLAGTAPLSVRAIEVNGISQPLTWTTITNWALTLPLYAGRNSLVVQGVDAAGLRAPNLLAAITVTNNGPASLFPVAINEWLADNAAPGGLPDPLTGRFPGWFELYNPNSLAVNLAGYSLTDTVADPTKWMIPSGTVIEPHSFLLAWAGGDPTPAASGASRDLHTPLNLKGAGGFLGLYFPGKIPCSLVTFGAQVQNVSQGRFPDGGENIQFMPPWTPRATNRLAAPPPGFGAWSLPANGAITLTLVTLPDRLYEVQFATDLSVPEWLPLSVFRATSSTQAVTDFPPAAGQRFYRVRLVP